MLELLVVLVILGLVASIATFAPAAVEPARPDPVGGCVARARREALRSGVPVTIEIAFQGRALSITALPDGSIAANPELGFDRLSGRRAEKSGAP